jgi:hypothetical protein
MCLLPLTLIFLVKLGKCVNYVPEHWLSRSTIYTPQGGHKRFDGRPGNIIQLSSSKAFLPDWKESAFPQPHPKLLAISSAMLNFSKAGKPSRPFPF